MYLDESTMLSSILVPRTLLDSTQCSGRRNKVWICMHDSRASFSPLLIEMLMTPFVKVDVGNMNPHEPKGH